MRKSKSTALINKLLQEIDDLHKDVSVLNEDLDRLKGTVDDLKVRQEALDAKAWKSSSFPVVTW